MLFGLLCFYCFAAIVWRIKIFKNKGLSSQIGNKQIVKIRHNGVLFIRFLELPLVIFLFTFRIKMTVMSMLLKGFYMSVVWDKDA